MLGLAFLFTCVTQPSSCRAQQLLEVQEKYLISSRHRSPRSNLKKRALGLVRPKPAGATAGDSAEQVPAEPCSGE